MAVFFTDLQDHFASHAFLEKVCTRFHYEETRMEELRAVVEEMRPLLSEEAFWESGRADAGQKIPYERVVISLGAGVDALQERYADQGLLSECYMLEALAGELLMQSYGAYNRYVEAATDLHVARYHFPGSEDAWPVEMLPKLLDGLTKRVVCNAAYCLLPKKSVVFIAELTKEEGVRCEGICAGCHHPDCPNRAADDFQERRKLARMADIPLGYGYSRIFGKI